MKLFVGNFDPKVKSEGLTALFSKFGEVSSSYIIKDKKTGESKGYGFVIMEDEKQAEAAIKALHGLDVKGMNLIVSVARDKNSKPEKPKPDKSARPAKPTRR